MCDKITYSIKEFLTGKFEYDIDNKYKSSKDVPFLIGNFYAWLCLVFRLNIIFMSFVELDMRFFFLYKYQVSDSLF